ncbi:DUF2069 domain-containing protein [Shewanella glacialipiscicola]|uniref:DUF2069 domain-containing protein n=1 Tax=Shewanella glacialipiscicola TaxID=614069 RepID=A0ABQ6J0R7_9GAMM|nr:DUF2069 domain-containing protein [Shewanella glacialipiscicola]MCL1087638.1 DUF2069 domain-containing protein [Shewanella glacialipiscicola]MCU7993601.1 DUF2069 domain-containing protein [Shewanella glacialipiscicola]MCU8024919.1 DUF2069 domain-containing protein [Shewanella glacialipiscicola]GIU11876.1 hypothetical protein TUM4636_21270 [Shewanella glacialipiscicola]GMA81731.1 hypothetical protein GCM10025855_12640 [Shewanella glacialipiscicola]
MTSNALFTLSRLGYFALVLLLGGWFVGQGMNGEYSLLFSLLWIVPLLLPAKGIYQGNPYTFAWASFVLCLYMLHALTLLYVTTDAFTFALIEVLLIGVLLIAFPFYARIRGRELGLGLKKKSKE